MSNPKLRSQFEWRIWKDLKKKKIKAEYEPFYIDYILQKRYLPDFVLPNGVLVEAKGVLDYESRNKLLAVKAQHPEYDIRIVFMNSKNKLKKGGKMTYAKWAEVNGFPWAEGFIPKEWSK